MEIKDIKCTCTPEQREKTFKIFINEQVNRDLEGFNYSIKHLTDSEKKELINKEIETYSQIFSSSFLISEPYRYKLHYKSRLVRYASHWREFKYKYENRFMNEFKDFHLESCPVLQPFTNEQGETYTPINPIRIRLNLAWFPYAYFFYLKLKEVAKGETIKDLNSKEVMDKELIKIETNRYKITLSDEEKQRKIFLNEIKSVRNFHEVLSKHEKYHEQIENDIIKEKIPYIFALFEYFGYRNELAKYFSRKSELVEFLHSNLSESMNETDIRKFWKCLDRDSTERTKKAANYNSFVYLKDIENKYPKN